MSLARRAALAGIAALFAAAPAAAQEGWEKYLTPEGNLRGPVELREEKGNLTFPRSGTVPQFNTFAARVLRVEPDGKWRTYYVFTPRAGAGEQLMDEKERALIFRRLGANFDRPPNQGLLTKEQLKDLAKAFARYDLAGLPSAGNARSNHTFTKLRFGGRESVLVTGVDIKLVPPNPRNPGAPPDGRFAGDGQIVPAPQTAASPPQDVVARYSGIVGTLRSIIGQ